MDIYYIYKATNKINGKSYIGFSTNFNKRLKEHKRNYKKIDYVLYRSIKKYGWDNFEWCIIYESWDSEHCLKVMESYFIKQYDTIKNGYNSTEGGQGTFGYKHRDESKQKMSIAFKGRTPWNKGKTGVYSEERLKEIRENNPFKKLKKTEEHKKNISKALTGKKKSKEHVQASILGRCKEYKMLNPQGEIINIKNMAEFCRINNLNQSHMISVFLGRYGFKSHKGYKRIID